jgi:ABC-type uncharacterized transport system permease subunit
MFEHKTSYLFSRKALRVSFWCLLAVLYFVSNIDIYFALFINSTAIKYYHEEDPAKFVLIFTTAISYGSFTELPKPSLYEYMQVFLGSDSL